MAIRYVGLGERGAKRFLFEADRRTKARQVLWGDFLDVEGTEPDGWLKVVWARNDPQKRRELFIRPEHTVERRPLEIVFVDVGQGDGAVLITPETGERERVVVIDAGAGDNMVRFLSARFATYRGFDFDAAVITHPDEDHYGGFLPLFANERVGFRTIYHSGLVERPVAGQFEKLGGLTPDGRWLTALPQDDQAIEALFGDAATIGRFKYPAVMHAAVANPRIHAFRMLCTEHGTTEAGRAFMPGFAPSDGRDYVIEVLGPLVEPDAQGRPRLRKLGSYGETKNGHSVLLRLSYGNLSVLFGGDLNDLAEQFLLTRAGGLDAFPVRGSDEHDQMLAAGRERFGADVMKVCHHGSDKVTDEFLEAVNPAAFVISSGDSEGHVHPRPDLLGRLGRFGRGAAPVLLSTELQRSTREREERTLVDALVSGIARLADQPTDALKAELTAKVAQLGRTNVESYGAIYVKTDGRRLIAAFRIEASSPLDRWFWFEYAFDADGQLTLVR